MEEKIKQQDCGIYKITNLINGKVYIGQSCHIKQRWQEHKRISRRKNSTQKLYIAFNEYGLENFLFEIIELCPKEELLKREEYYINFYQSSLDEKGYNMKKKGCFNQWISDSTVEGICKDLQNLEMTRNEIAQKWKVSPCYVSNVNKGILRPLDNYSYPIRPIQERNKRERNYCLNCGKEISYDAKRCQSCANKEIAKHRKNNIENRITKKELKIKIRTMSFSAIGREYNVSDNAIRKWCKHFNLPHTKKEINSYSDEEWENI